MGKKKVDALVLPDEACAVKELQLFPIGVDRSFPGEYMPGVPVALATLGIDKKEAQQLLADYEAQVGNPLPLQFTTTDEPDTDLSATAGIPSAATVPSGVAVEAPPVQADETAVESAGEPPVDEGEGE